MTGQTFGVEVLGTDFTDSSGAATSVSVSNLAFQGQINKIYLFEFNLFVVPSVTTRGAAFTVNASPTTAPTYLACHTKIATTTTEGTDSFYESHETAFDAMAAAPGDLASTNGVFATIKGIIQPAATQAIFPILKPEAVAGTITVKANLSHCIWRQI